MGLLKKITTNCDYQAEHSRKKRPIAQELLAAYEDALSLHVGKWVPSKGPALSFPF